MNDSRHKINLNFVERLMIEKSMARKDLAEKLEVDISTVNKWLNGSVEPPAHRKIAIARLLGVDSRTIFPMPGEMPVEVRTV